ncbi:uncharacterized protein LOC114286796 [Camellia sinensis]|uniref:3'-5' exonuclease domain-containing protein n=1 Tax=Camellia sinensis var. sinensis TaxID=542762 RepID=A0A4V3WM31_CAMSN|nr:uncharacterized protein LOC114286796 [Camellia sinensis]THG06917.1 hypothetical protein TEA_005151 [Camellia sinensis var. sinensis]
MEVTVTKCEEQDCDCDLHYYYDAYTVFVGEHRILTISTANYITTTRWIKEVQKTYRHKHGPLIVGVCVDRQSLNFTSNGLEDSPYDLLQLCIGSHCLIYRFSDPYCYRIPKSLQEFFDDRRVIAVGMDMVSVAKKLERNHEIKVANPMDLNSMAVKGLRRDDLDLLHYGLNRLARVVLGKHVYVFRPCRYKVEWFQKYDGGNYNWYNPHLSHEKVKFATSEPYLCYLIGSKLLGMMNCSSSASSSSSKKKTKKKNSKKKK